MLELKKKKTPEKCALRIEYRFFWLVLFVLRLRQKMPPQPLESVQNLAAAALTQANEAQAPRGGTISLGMLIDFIIQRTYHELTVLAEL